MGWRESRRRGQSPEWMKLYVQNTSGGRGELIGIYEAREGTTFSLHFL